MHPGAWMQKKWYLTYAGDRVQSSCYWTSHSGLKYLTDFREWQWVWRNWNVKQRCSMWQNTVTYYLKWLQPKKGVAWMRRFVDWLRWHGGSLKGAGDQGSVDWLQTHRVGRSVVRNSHSEAFPKDGILWGGGKFAVTQKSHRKADILWDLYIGERLQHALIAEHAKCLHNLAQRSSGHTVDGASFAYDGI